MTVINKMREITDILEWELLVVSFIRTGPSLALLFDAGSGSTHHWHFCWPDTRNGRYAERLLNKAASIWAEYGE